MIPSAKTSPQRGALFIAAITLLLLPTLACGDDDGGSETVRNNVRITSPGLGASFDAGDDVNDSIPGVQIDVAFTVEGFEDVVAEVSAGRPDGTGLISRDRVTVRKPGSYSSSGQITIRPGDNEVVVRILDGQAQLDVDRLNVTLAGDNVGVRIASPSDGAVLNRAGQPFTVRVELTGTNTAQRVAATANGAGIGEVFDVTSGAFVFTNVGFDEGDNEIVAFATIDGTDYESDPITVTVDTAGPAIGIEAQLAFGSPAQQIPVECGPGEDGTSVFLYRAGVIGPCGGNSFLLGEADCVGDEARIQTALSEGSHDVFACAVDNVGNDTRVFAEVIVDLAPPNVSFGFEEQTIDASAEPDADPGSGFYQASFTVDCDDSAEVELTNTTNGASRTEDCTGGSATFLITLDAGENELELFGVDDAGNMSETDTATVTLLVVDCGFTLVDPTDDPWRIRASDDRDSETEGAQVVVVTTVYDRNCVGGMVTADTNGEMLTVEMSSAGRGALDLSYPDQTETTLTLTLDNDGAMETIGPIDVRVNLTRPEVECLVPQPLVLGIADDMTPGDDLQYELPFSVFGAIDGTVVVDPGTGGEVQTINVDADGEDSVEIELPHQAPGQAPYTVTLTATSASDVTEEATCAIAVDLVAPNRPQDVTATLMDRRLGATEIELSESGDDGGTDGPVAMFEVAVTVETPADPPDFDDAEMVLSIPGVEAGFSTTGTIPSLDWTPPTTGAEPQRVHSFLIRAIDEAGNVSEIATASVTTELLEGETRVSAAPAGFGANVFAIGDVNTDGRDDILVTDPASDTAWLLPGTNDIAGFATAPMALELTGPTDSGFGTAAIGLGDVNGDGYDDWAISAPGEGAGGAVYVYLGVVTDTLIDLDFDVRILGDSGNNLGDVLAGGDVLDVGGENLSDVIVRRTRDDAGDTLTGVLVVTGRAAWTNDDTPAEMDLSTLSADFAAAQITVLETGVADDGFGDAVVVAPDANDDGSDDLVVGAPSAATVFVVELDDLEATVADNGTPITAPSGDMMAFGAALAPSAGPNGESGVAIAEPGADTVYVYQLTGAFDDPPASTVNAADDGLFGARVAWVDVNADGVADLVAGTDSAAGEPQSFVVAMFDEEADPPYTTINIVYDDRQDGGMSTDWAESLVAIGDFDGNGTDDLIVGQPGLGDGQIVLLY